MKTLVINDVPIRQVTEYEESFITLDPLTRRPLTDSVLFDTIDVPPTLNEYFYNITKKDISEWNFNLTEKTIEVTYTVLPLEFSQVTENLVNYVYKLRKEFEAAHVFLDDGTEIRTDEKSQARITQAFLQVQKYPETIYNWKMLSGEFRVLDKDLIELIHSAIHAHIESAFTQEFTLNTLINEKETIDELELLFPLLVFS